MLTISLITSDVIAFPSAWRRTKEETLFHLLPVSVILLFCLLGRSEDHDLLSGVIPHGFVSPSRITDHISSNHAALPA
jgi:hypothetical protein